MYLKTPDTRFLVIAGVVLLGFSLASYGALGGWGLAVTVPVATALVVFVVLDRHRHTAALQERHRDQIQALMGLHALFDVRAPLPMMSSWAATPELASLVVREYLGSGARCVLEIGSGASTIVTGYMAEKAGDGHVHSLDHDVAFAEKTRDQIRLHGLQGKATVYDAPLKQYEIGGASWLWYDLDRLPEDLRFDLVVVDGPPLSTQDLARYPALPLLAGRLNDGAIILLDDAARDSEQAVVKRWRDEFGSQLTWEYISSMKGTAILRWNAS